MKILNRNKINKFIELLIFEAIYRFVAIMIFIPFLGMLIDFNCYICGYQYINFEIFINNLYDIRIYPIFIIICLLIAIFIFIEFYISMIIFYSSQGDKYSLRAILKSSIYELKRAFRLRNIFILLIALYLGVFSFFSNGFIRRIRMPLFIKEAILNNSLISVLYYILIILFGCITILLIFVFNEFFIKKSNLRDSLINSIKTVYGKFIYLALGIICIRVSIYVISFILSYFLILFNKVFININWKTSLFMYIVYGSMRMFLLLGAFAKFVFMVTGIRYFVFSVYLNRHRNACNSWDVYKIVCLNFSGKMITLKRVILCFYLFFVFNIVYYTYIVNSDKNPLIVTKITAHRGAGYYYLENTLESINMAKNIGVEYSEIDVQITKDNRLILLHDDNFNRVCGDKRAPINMTLEEIKKLKYLPYRDIYNTSEKVPTLDEVIDYAIKINHKLNIEIKGEDNIIERTAKKVSEMIKDKNFYNNCIVTSLNSKALITVKKQDENIKTGYIVFATNNKVVKLPYVDAVCIEQGIVNRKFVDIAHNNGKQVCVWTVNNSEDIDKFLELGVDNIITDIPKEAIYYRDIFDNISVKMRKMMKFLN